MHSYFQKLVAEGSLTLSATTRMEALPWMLMLSDTRPVVADSTTGNEVQPEGTAGC